MATATMERKKRVKEKPQGTTTTPEQSSGGIRLETPEQLLRVDQFERHPDNRIPKPEDVEARARSIQEKGQIDPILARRREGCELYQILSGETRWRAHQLLGAVMIKARVIECSDREAIEYLAAANTERSDLKTSDRARLAAAMMAAGLKRDEVAPKVGVTSGSAVSNLIKVLEAPECWLRALDEGVVFEGHRKTIFEGTVREVAKIREAPELAEKILEDFEKGSWFPETRDEQISRIHQSVHARTRSMTQQEWYGSRDGVSVHEHHKPRFKVDAHVRERLRVVNLPIRGGEMDERALDAEEFDRLQWEALAKLVAKREGTTSRKNGTEVSDADRAKEQAAKLREFAEKWRILLLRVGLAKVIDIDTAPLMFCWLAPALANDRHLGLGGCISEAAAYVARSPESCRLHKRTTDLLFSAAKACSDGSHDSAAGLVLRRACQRALWPVGDDDKPPEAIPYLDARDVEAWAEEHGITVEGQWDYGRAPSSQRELIRSLICRHTTVQLRDLCEEQGVDAGATASKAELVELLMEYHRTTGLDVPAVVPSSGKRSKRKGGAS